jgi:lysophospholipase L1-like esterase
VKRLLANAALTLIATAVAFAVCEGLARLVLKQKSTVLFPRYHTDYEYGPYRLRGIVPNAEFWHTSADGSWKFVTNSKGFRNVREFPYAKAAGTLRVLGLGDSHTQGYEVRQEATYSAVLERHLHGYGINAEVINAGVSGFSNAEALAFLENEGVKYRPDVVVLGFFANDFGDNLRTGLYSLGGRGELQAERFEYLPGVRAQKITHSLPPLRWLGENSYAYSVLFNGVWRFLKAARAESAAREAREKGISLPPDSFEYALGTGAAPSTYEIDLAFALVARMQLVCHSHGIRFIVVDIPLRLAGGGFATSVPPALALAFEKAGVEFISAAELFPGGPSGPVHVAHGHFHISEFTHGVIGAKLGDRLRPLAIPRGQEPRNRNVSF